METISEQVRKRTYVDMDSNGQQFLPQVALTRAPEGIRKTGRPRETWRRSVERE